MRTVLLKYPTRQRPRLFRLTLRKYIDTAGAPLRIVVTIDVDDISMNNRIMRDWIAEQGAEIDISPRRGKIIAINSGIPADQWSVLVLASDDHIPVTDGWALRILSDMPEDGDALLWYKDIRQDRICLMPVMGRSYYDRFGYIYHPAYVSLWCDNEQTEVAQSLGKLIQPDSELFRNESADWGGIIRTDSLYRKNNAYYKIDRQTYERRKLLNFPKQ